MSLPDLQNSIANYEKRLVEAFGDAVRQTDLKLKHERMRESAFLFLRATCWRWAESAAFLCPELMNAPPVLSVGDAHAGNFGLWRDAQFRLVWGVNDYDEAARLPYAFDLVRLCASLLLADKTLSVREVAKTILRTYKTALKSPQPTVLEDRNIWLRDLFEASDEDRDKFWKKLRKAKPEPVKPSTLVEPLRKALPEGVEKPRMTARSAGAGSLGRPRFVAYADYRGGPLAFEIKGQMSSCWGMDHEPGISEKIGFGRYRSPDPTLIYTDAHVVRRLSPNNRKLDFVEIKQALRGKLIETMVAELASIHADDPEAKAILRDLAHRPSDWLSHSAKIVADWTSQEWKSFRRMGRDQA